MTIERITKAKAESLVMRIPSLGSVLPLKDESAGYYLISVDGVLSVTFSVAVVEDGVITYISDESLRETMERYLESN
jgi:hypothetical protein